MDRPFTHLWLGLGAMAAVGVIYNIFTDGLTPEWLQAIGAIVALAVSVYFAAQARDAARTAEMRAVRAEEQDRRRRRQERTNLLAALIGLNERALNVTSIVKKQVADGAYSPKISYNNWVLWLDDCAEAVSSLAGRTLEPAIIVQIVHNAKCLRFQKVDEDGELESAFVTQVMTDGEGFFSACIIQAKHLIENPPEH